MIYSTSFLVLPLLILLWACDAWLFLLMVRFVLRRTVADERMCPWQLSVMQLTDGIPGVVREWLARQHLERNPKWLSWAIVIVLVVIFRQLLAWMIVASS